MRRLAVVIGMSFAVPAMANDADLIEGFRTNDFLRALPQQADQLVRQGMGSDPKNGLVKAQYADAKQTRKAQVLIYRAPDGVDVDDYVETVLESTEKAMRKAGAQPSRRDYTSPSDTVIQCLDGNQKQKILHSVCLASVKGRVVDVQPLAAASNGVNKEAFEQSNAFVSAVVDAIAS